ncbi:hypothetical protein Ahy_B01g056368 [Arachis hypogaea]|uniref:Transposase MuDR plant domain-containing protein n=1 Tax=Arachis hypogaea TaxID=3818 RepID=A0A445AYR1_ARAHY|nr:hypothetical protein Ahy_B01g056368 [Arachis hypogaea]
MSITIDACMQQIFYIDQQTRFHVPLIELYVEFKQHTGLDGVGEEVNFDELGVGDIDWEEDNNDNEEEFEANYEVDDKNNDEDLANNPAVQNEANAIVNHHPFGVPSFMRTLDLAAMHAPEFPKYTNMDMLWLLIKVTTTISFICLDRLTVVRVSIEFGSRESVISAIKSYTISREVDYTVYEFEPQIFYEKCKGYGAWYDWLIRASLIERKIIGRSRDTMANTRAPWGRFHRIMPSYSSTEQEYNKNYQWLKERNEAYTQ